VVKTVPRQIVAFGGGGFSMESGNPLLDDYVLALTRAERPRVSPSSAGSNRCAGEPAGSA